MSFQTKQELRDLQAELDRLDTVLHTFKDPFEVPWPWFHEDVEDVNWVGVAHARHQREQTAAHARIRAAFHLGRTTFSNCLNVIIFGDLHELGLLRDAVKKELASATACEGPSASIASTVSRFSEAWVDDDWDDDDE